MTAKTNAEHQRAWKARQIASGLREVRGIWLKPELHDKLRELAKALANQNSQV